MFEGFGPHANHSATTHAVHARSGQGLQRDRGAASKDGRPRAGPHVPWTACILGAGSQCRVCVQQCAAHFRLPCGRGAGSSQQPRDGFHRAVSGDEIHVSQWESSPNDACQDSPWACTATQRTSRSATCGTRSKYSRCESSEHAHLAFSPSLAQLTSANASRDREHLDGTACCRHRLGTMRRLCRNHTWATVMPRPGEGFGHP